jgi:glutamate decarboxylase
MQYYNFLRLGKDGYRRAIQTCLAVAQYIARSLEAIGAPRQCFAVVSDTQQMPIVAFRLVGGPSQLTLSSLAKTLRLAGWIVPVYRLPSDLEEIEVMRVVVRPDLAWDEAALFVADVVSAVEACHRAFSSTNSLSPVRVAFPSAGGATA